MGAKGIAGKAIAPMGRSYSAQSSRSLPPSSRSTCPVQ